MQMRIEDADVKDRTGTGTGTLKCMWASSRALSLGYSIPEFHTCRLMMTHVCCKLAEKENI